MKESLVKDYDFGLPFSYSSFILLTRTLFLVQKNKILKLWLTYGKCLRLEATNAHHGDRKSVV